MASEIQIFNYEKHDVRVINKDGEVWLVAADVCDVLGLTNAREAIKALDDDEKNTVRISDGNRGNPNINVINEPGAYKLIMRSNKPEAKAFQRWLAHDVIPAIIKHGGYSISPDTAKRLDLQEKRLAIMEKNANTRQAKILQRMIENPAYPLTDDSKRVLAHEVTFITTGRAHPEILPDATERLYSAKQVGDEMGISNRAVHKIAAALCIKPEEGTRNEYAVWKMSKSPYSARECAQIFFTESGKRMILDSISVAATA